MSDSKEHYQVRFSPNHTDPWEHYYNHDNEQAARDEFEELKGANSRARILFLNLTTGQVIDEQ